MVEAAAAAAEPAEESTRPRRRKAASQPTVENRAQPAAPARRPRSGRSDGPVAPLAARSIEHVAVARRAFVFFLERGAKHGHDVEDWLRAEREVREEAAARVVEGQVPVRRSRPAGSARAGAR
jgi:hypothetical protein